MSSFADNASPAELSAYASSDSTKVKSPFWRITLLVAINFLSVPLAIPLIYYPEWFFFPGEIPIRRPVNLGPVLWFTLVGMYHAYLFLLAYWMTFGTTPFTNRKLLVTFLAAMGAAPIAAMMAHRTALAIRKDLSFGWEEIPAVLPYVFGPTLMAMIVVWFLHLFLIIPQRTYSIDVRFLDAPPLAPAPLNRSVLRDVLYLVIALAIPLVLATLLYIADDIFVQKMALSTTVSTLFSLFALTPAALLLVTDSKFAIKFGGVVIWMLICMILFLLAPPQWQPEDGVLVHVATCVTVLLNILVLRAFGLRWLAGPTASKVGTAQ